MFNLNSLRASFRQNMKTVLTDAMRYESSENTPTPPHHTRVAGLGSSNGEQTLLPGAVDISDTSRQERYYDSGRKPYNSRRETLASRAEIHTSMSETYTSKLEP